MASFVVVYFLVFSGVSDLVLPTGKKKKNRV